MKVASTVLLAGAASAALTPPQQVFQLPKVNLDSWAKPLEEFGDALKSLSGEARQLWDEMAMMFPESFEKASFLSAPKPHKKKADKTWDHIMRGADVQSVWEENADGEKERKIGGSLSSYSLRSKKVDPKSLGVDKVKQYSGYLDDDENDKHLFYCKTSTTSSMSVC